MNDNATLASRLRKKLNQHRDDDWTHYVNHISKLYQTPKEEFDSTVTNDGYEQYDRKFLLINQKFEDIDFATLESNYGYSFGKDFNEVYLLIPENPSMHKFNGKWFIAYSCTPQTVENVDAAKSIGKLISEQNATIREATWDDMDNILIAFSDSKQAVDDDCDAPEFFSRKKNPISSSKGIFHSSYHAPNSYALKKYILNCFSKQLEVEKEFRKKANHLEKIHQDQDNAEKLLNLSWFSRAKENFSWSPLVDGFLPHSSKSHQLLNTTPKLKTYNDMAYKAMQVEAELNKNNFNASEIRQKLLELKEFFDKHERNNIFIDLFCALVGVISAPIAFLIGFLWLIPANIYDLPYFGTSAFFLDACQWFIESCLTTVRCLIFPIAMIHAYNTTGSSDVLKGECTRIVETLLERTKDTSNQICFHQ